METTNKHNTLIVAVGALVIGVLVGAFLFGSKQLSPGSHQMPNGEMMGDEMMHQGMTMGQMMDTMSANLKGKSGNEFDAAFLEEMIPHHKGAIEMAQMVLSQSKRPELIKLANDVIAAQQKEIDMMRGWQRAWFGIQAQ